MDPENSQGPSVNPDLQKLENDLKNLQVNPPAEVVTPVEASPQPLPEVVTSSTDTVMSDVPPSTKKSGVMIIAIILMIIAAASVVAYFLMPKYFGTGVTPQACTMEAKLCPDGSSVGRTAPNCEFEVCPAYIPVSTLIPMPTASASALPTVTPKATSTPVSSPSASPSI